MKKYYPLVPVNLVTNGIKLADLNYVRKLKEAGLKLILFSLNSFDDYVYQKINNAKLLDIKMRALKNLKKEKIMTVLSPTLVRGLNEKDLKPIINFALNNLDFVYGIRIRGVAKVGRHPEINPLTASEMLKLVSDSLGVEPNFFLKNFSRKDSYHSAYAFHAQLFIDQGKNQKRIIDWDYIEKYKKFTIGNVIRSRKILLNILSRKKRNDIIKALIKSGVLMPASHKYFQMSREYFYFLEMLNIDILRINVWYWADKSNMDLNDARAGGVKHTTADGRILTFGEAMIRAEEL